MSENGPREQPPFPLSRYKRDEREAKPQQTREELDRLADELARKRGRLAVLKAFKRKGYFWPGD